MPEGRHSPYFVLFWNRIRAFYCTRGARRLAGITDVEAKFIKSKIDFGIGHVQSLIGRQDKTATPGQDSLTERLVREVRQTGMEREEYKPVLMKAAKEQLTSSQARKVAEAVKQAETPEERQAILETPIDNPMFDRIVRAIMKLFDNQMR